MNKQQLLKMCYSEIGTKVPDYNTSFSLLAKTATKVIQEDYEGTKKWNYLLTLMADYLDGVEEPEECHE